MPRGRHAGARHAPCAGRPVHAQPIVCDAAPGPVAVGTAQWNGWGRDTDNSRYQPEPALRAADVPRLSYRWAYGFAGAEDAGPPAVVDGRLFIGDSTGNVVALDTRSGCSYWNFAADAAVRSAITIGELAASKTLPGQKPSRRRHQRTDAHVEVVKPPSAVFFGDDAGMVYSLDARRGSLLWKTQADADPALRVSGAPLLYGKALYLSLAPMEGAPAAPPAAGSGAVVALDLWTGRLLWKAAADVRSGPTIDVERQLLYVATSEGIVALDLAGGAERWRKAAPTGAEFRHSPILRRLAGAGQILIAVSRDGKVYGFDPARSGELIWQTRAAAEPGELRIEWGAAADHHSVYVGTSLAGLAALDLATGRLRWQARLPQPPAHALTAIPGMLFSAALDGHLRAVSTIGGRIVWDTDTSLPYLTVNGATARGGAPGHGGVIVVDGMLFLNSGNSLLAFSIDGK
jgi:polyvinyl alcohol dehydrogenase (cytochrome)